MYNITNFFFIKLKINTLKILALYDTEQMLVWENLT